MEEAREESDEENNDEEEEDGELPMPPFPNVAEQNEEIERLRNNDPELNIALMPLHNHNVLAYGQALQGNTFVQIVWLHLSGLTDDAPVELMLEFFRSSPTLRVVTMSGSRTSETPPAVANRFLQAVSQNQKIEQLFILQMNLHARILHSIGHDMASLSCLDIGCCVLHGSPHEFETCFAENRTIAFLKILHVPQSILIPLLRGATSHLRLQDLVVCSPIDNIGTESCAELSEVLCGLIQSSPQLNHLGLVCFEFEQNNFAPIAQCIRNCQALAAISLSFCDFDESSARCLADALLASPVHTLAFDNDNDFRAGSAAESILSAIKMLRITATYSGIPATNVGMLEHESFQDFMKAFERPTTLEVLATSVVNRESEETLLRMLPRMWNLKALQVNMNRNTFVPNNSEEWTSAFQRNLSLEWSLMTSEVGTALLFPEQQELLTSYCLRNRDVHYLYDAPDSVPLALWPHIISRTLQFDVGHSLVFDCLSTKLADSVWVMKKRSRATNHEKTQRSVRPKD
jgi:hypothetical protein